MSEKLKSYQQIQEQYQNNQEELEAQQNQEDAKERQKTLPGDQAHKYLMDADQLKAYYEERNRDTDENAFKIRTKYYFEDVGRATAKKDRYQSISNQAPMIEAYARRHGGRRASKRQGDARKAKESFQSMEHLMRQQQQNNQENLTPLEKYQQREEIMKHRMTGMIAAAQLKSKPGNMHHSMYRAQLSCYMILKDQLEHLIREQQSVQDRTALQKKLTQLNTKIDSTYTGLKKYTPTVQQQWQDDQFTGLRYNTARDGYQRVCNRGVTVSMETAKMLLHLQKFHEKMGGVKWPARCVYKFSRGDAPLNPAERKLQEWNNRVAEIRDHGSDYAKEQVEEEGIRLFMSTELPDAKALKKMGATYLEDHLRTYYEMIHRALPYYREELSRGEGIVFEYAQKNSGFEEKLDYLEAIKDYMEYRLSMDYGIQTDPERGYVIRKSGRGYTPMRIRAGRSLFENDPESNLDKAYRFYGVLGQKRQDQADLMPKIEVQAQRPADEDEEEEQEQNLIRNEENHEIRNEENNEIRNEENNDIRNEEIILVRNDVQPVVQPEVQPVAQSVNKDKTDNIQIVENRLYSDMIVKEEKKEDLKEDNRNEIIEKNQNHIFEEENQNRIIIEEEAPVRMIKQATDLTQHQAYQQILTGADEVFTKYLGKKKEQEKEGINLIIEDEEEIRSQKKNEMVSSMMRLVHFDKNGAPITKEDQKNHAWNLKWLNAWKNDDVTVREEMIDEELERLSGSMVRIPKGESEETGQSKKTKDASGEMMASYRQKLNTWVRTEISEKKNDGLVASLRKMQALKELQKAHPGVRDYIRNNPAFHSYVSMAGNLSSYIVLVQSMKDGNNRLSKDQKTKKQSALALKILEKNNQFLAHEKDDFVPYQSRSYLALEKDSDVEKELHTPESMKEFQLTEAHFGKKRTKEQSKELAFAKKQVELLKRYKKTYEFETHKEYQALYKQTGVEKGTTLGRTFMVMMRPVIFDQNGTPLPKYQKNHQWNLRWLKLWVKKEDKQPKDEKEKEALKLEKERIEKEKEKMLQTYYPHTLDGLTVPEVKLSKADMEIMRKYTKLTRQEEAVKKKEEEREEALRKSNPKISFLEIKNDPVYKKVSEERTLICDQKNAMDDSVMAVAERYAKSRQFKEWIEGRLQDNSEQEFIRHFKENTQGAVDSLRDRMPSLKAYEEQNPKFVQKGLLIDKAHFLYNDFVGNNYGIDISAGYRTKRDWLEDDEARNGSLTVTGMRTMTTFLTTWMDYHYEETQNVGEEDAQELARIQKEENKHFTRKDYEFYKKIRAMKTLTLQKPYQQIFNSEKTKKVRAKYGLKNGDTIDRFALPVFKPVKFDQLDQPVTEEDEKNHAWNLKWMKAWEDDDVSTREEMIADRLPHLFDGIKLPDFNLSKGDRQAFEEMNTAEETYHKAKADLDKCNAAFRAKKSRLDAVMKEASEAGDDAHYQATQKELADLEKAHTAEKSLLQKAADTARVAYKKAEEKEEVLRVKYQGVYTKWVEGIVKNQDTAFIFAALSGLSFDILQTLHPSVKRFFEQNPQFTLFARVIDNAMSALSAYVVEAKHRFTIGAEVKIQDEAGHMSLEDMYKENMGIETGGFFRALVKYDKVKKQKLVPFTSLSSTENYLTNQEEREEYQALLKKQPNLTQKGYGVMKLMKTVRSVATNKEYSDEYLKARDVLKGAQDGTFTRDATLIMRHVNFDKKGQPISKQDQENHAWNKKWLKAIDDDDFELREQMLSEEIPHRFQVKDLPKPSEKLLSLRRQLMTLPQKQTTWNQKRVAAEYKKERDRFQRELERFTEEKMKNEDVEFFRDLMSGMTVDTLRKGHPSLQQYLDNNPEIQKRSTMVDAYQNIVAPYLSRTYFLSTGTSVGVLPLQGEKLENKQKAEQETENQMTDDFLDKYMAYQEVQDTPYVPYQTIIRKEDRLRKEKRLVVKREKEQKAREEAERKKKLEPVFQEYKKVNPKFDPKHYNRLQQTNLRGEMFQNKEYLELAKKVTLKGFAGPLSGPMSFGLETVETDEMGNVKDEYKEAHENNKAWLNMLIQAGGTGDMRAIQAYMKKEMATLAEKFLFPASHSLGDFGPFSMFMKDPLKMTSQMQKIKAYQEIVKANPPLSLSAVKQDNLGAKINLLMQARDLILEDTRQYNGIDFSGDTYQVVKPGQMTPEQIKAHEEKQAQYLKAKAELKV